MQQAIYNNISNTIAIQTTKTVTPAKRQDGLGRHIAQKWDLVGLLALMGSSAAYGAFALAHLV